MIIGIFSDVDQVNKALLELKANGIDNQNISVVVQDEVVRERIETTDTVKDTSDNVAEGATSGAIVGGLVGLVAGLAALTVPGLGALLIGGPIASALGLTGVAATAVSGTATGALAGGFVGALVGLGVPEERARMYEERIRSGAVLIGVEAEGADSEDVSEIFKKHGAEEISVTHIT